MKKLIWLLMMVCMLSACGGNTNVTSYDTPSMASVYKQLAAQKQVAKSAAAAPSETQKMAVIKLFQAMFNASPGADLLNLCAGFLAGGMSESTLANLLAGTALFQMESLYPSGLSNQNFCLKFVNNLVGATVSETNKSALATQMAALLDGGWQRGDLMWLLVSALSNVPSAEPAWGMAAAQLNNRLNVSYYYSVTRAVPSSDIATLQAVTASVNNDPASVTAATAAINAVAVTSVATVSAPKIMYGTASSITLDGVNLDMGITVAAGGACTGLTESAGGTAVKRVYSCIPATLDPLTIIVTGRNGELLKTETFAIPNPQVTMVTGKGTIVVELNPAKAPITVNNFLTYVHEGFYNSTIFHRVVPGFVIQGGGYSTSGIQKATHSPIALEAPSATGLTNAEGTIAMARTTDLNSATSQFFINTVNNNNSAGNNLDVPAGQGYAVFGRVISGMDVAKLIESTPIIDPSKASSFVAVISMEQTR